MDSSKAQRGQEQEEKKAFQIQNSVGIISTQNGGSGLVLKLQKGGLQVRVLSKHSTFVLYC